MTTETAILERECLIFTRYLIGEDPAPYVVQKYREAHDVVGSLGNGRPFDRALVRAARRGRRWAGWADAYARRFADRGLLRRKLILLFAILETSAPSCYSIDSVGAGGVLSQWLGLFGAGLGATTRLLIGLLLFVPLRLLQGGEGGLMPPVTVVGSGASGVHFAWTLLQKGHEVTMLDVGYPGSEARDPEATLDDLKDRLSDPSGYFLGSDYEGVVLPTDDSEYYGIPPSKSYIFDKPDGFDVRARGFAPLFSFAQGGLAEAWTAGCYPLNDAELTDFPWGYAELGPHYDEVARRIGVTGADDDLARFMPLHEHLLDPLDLDEHSRLLVRRYEAKKDRINRELGCWLGRTRVATLSRDLGSRGACSYLGRCLWGCPVGALYTPSETLRRCRESSRFTYRSGLEVQFFRYDEHKRIHEVVARDLNSGEQARIPVACLALAAGTLPTSKIVLRSVYEAGGELPRLPGLMDNRQVLMPFVNLRMIGRPFSSKSYQYHLLGMGLEAQNPAEYVHGQITTLKTALMHPIIQQVPLDLRASSRVARTVHAALGVVNVNFHDTWRESNHLRLETGNGEPRLVVQYEPPAAETTRMNAVLKRVSRVLRKLGCIVPPGMAHVRPMGASVHYAGTLPMRESAGRWGTTADCRSREWENLYLVDGATYPFLPAKNLTFTLMANATRVASTAF